MNGDEQVVDKIKNLVGGTATIFMKDVRVTTNVLKEDGSRAVGTTLAAGPVYDAIFKRGESYRGQADILGDTYFTVYDPIMDRDGKIIGILYVGVNKDDIFAVTNNIIDNITVAVILFGLLFCLLSTFLFRHIIIKPVLQGITVTRDIARGNLTARIDVERNDELGDLFEALDLMQAKLIEVISGIRKGANDVNASSGQLENSNTELSQRTQEQASSLQNVTSSMEEMTSTIAHNADNAHQVNQLAKHAFKQADEGKKIVGSAVNAMNIINNASRNIAEIIAVIDEIAFQTNLLALNASVEAARAGEHGRGFGVVAEEVRNLAGRCKAAAKDIKEQINDSVEKIKDGTALVNKSGEALDGILQEVKKVSTIVEEIAATSQEQAAGIVQVNKAMLQLDEMTQNNTSLVEQAAAVSESMAAQAAALRDLVDYFKLDEIEQHTLDNPAPQGAAMLPAVTTQAAPMPGLPENTATSASPPARPASGNDDSDWQEF